MIEIIIKLSKFIQIEQSEKMTEVSLRLADELMVRLQGVSPTRDLLEIQNIYAFFLMYALITKDLMLFLRILFNNDEMALQNIYQESMSLKNSRDKLVKPALLKQFTDFHNEQQHIFNKGNLTLAKYFAKTIKFKHSFYNSCYVVAREYINVEGC